MNSPLLPALLLVFTLCTQPAAHAQFIALFDDFSTAGDLVGTSADSGDVRWAAVQGAGGPTVSNGALNIDAASGDVAQWNFSDTNITAGTIYLGFNFTVSSAGSLNVSETISAFTGFRTGTPSSGSVVLGFGTFRPNGNAQAGSSLSSTSTSQVYAGIFAGVTHNAHSAPLAAWTTPLDRGTDYRAVIGFDLSNDLAHLWIDPSSSDSPSITLTGLTGSPRGIFVREGAASHGAILFDNLSVSLDFNTAAGLAAVPEPSTCAAVFGALSLVGAILYQRRRKHT